MEALFSIVFSAIVLVALSSCSVGNPTQNAVKVGQISRVADEGIICKTTTVLITGKFGGGELTVTVPEYNTELLNKIHHYNDTQEQVKITYHASLLKTSCSNETSNRFLDSIDVHPEGAAK